MIGESFSAMSTSPAGRTKAVRQVCGVCGGEFVGWKISAGRMPLCGHECKRERNRLREAKRQGYGGPRYCQECGELLGEGRRKWCKGCSKRVNRERAQKASRERALKTAGTASRAKPGMRRCLGCGKTFPSNGPWNRFHQACYERAAGGRTARMSERLDEEE